MPFLFYNIVHFLLGVPIISCMYCTRATVDVLVFIFVQLLMFSRLFLFYKIEPLILTKCSYTVDAPVKSLELSLVNY